MSIKVSITTLTSRPRLPFLKILAQCIENQDYEFIKEWVILDTSGVNGSETNPIEGEIKSLKPHLTRSIDISYHKAKGDCIGKWRNEANSLCDESTEIIVHLDDDDFYPPERVSHAVEVLSDKKSNIAGCNNIFFYDVSIKKVYQINSEKISNPPFNNTLAYWKDLLKTKSFNPESKIDEEIDFMTGLNVAVLDPNKTIVQIHHETCMHNRRLDLFQNISIPPEKGYIVEQGVSFDRFVCDRGLSKQYDALFKLELEVKDSPYDIVYFMGCMGGLLWSPKFRGSNGSEQAVVKLSEYWAGLGKKVGIYGSLSFEGVHNGVNYHHYSKFRFWDKFKTLILWRLYGVYTAHKLNITAEKIIIDLHDHNVELYKAMLSPSFKNAIYMTKSNFHSKLIKDSLKELNLESPLLIPIPNGIQIKEFYDPNSPIQRNPFRACYCSCYSKGALRILKGIWPKIFELEPRAELHLYYGMQPEIVGAQTVKDIVPLLTQGGVMDHNRQPVEVISREKHMSGIHLFYTDTLLETDCISIRESLVAGCIPVISDTNLFAERDGYKIKWLPDTPEYNGKIAEAIVDLMRNGDLQNDIRTKLLDSKTILSWEDVGKAWEEFI